MKMKSWDPKKRPKSVLTSKVKNPKGPVDVPDKALRGPSAPVNPRGDVGTFYEPDTSFYKGPSAPVRKKTKMTSNPKIGRSSTSKKMAKKKPDTNKGIG